MWTEQWNELIYSTLFYKNLEKRFTKCGLTVRNVSLIFGNDLVHLSFFLNLKRWTKTCIVQVLVQRFR